MPRADKGKRRVDEATREELDRRIVAAGFGGYEDHAAWLAGEGHAISRGALQRYGRRLKEATADERMRSRASVAAVVERVGRSAEIARAINAASEGDSLDIGQRTAELLMARLYDVAAREDVDAKTLQAVSRSLNSTLGTIASARGLRGEERRQAVEEAKDRAADVAGGRGLHLQTVAILRAAMQGDDAEDQLKDEEAVKGARREAVEHFRRRIRDQI